MLEGAYLLLNDYLTNKCLWHKIVCLTWTWTESYDLFWGCQNFQVPRKWLGYCRLTIEGLYTPYVLLMGCLGVTLPTKQVSKFMKNMPESKSNWVETLQMSRDEKAPISISPTKHDVIEFAGCCEIYNN